MRRSSLFLCAILAGCGEPISVDADAGLDAGPLDAGDASLEGVDVYDANHLLNVEITIPRASWDALRAETRDIDETLGGDCLAAPFGSPFTWFEASMSIDGTHFARVDVRKKGFLGSLSSTQPALKVDIGEYVDGQTYAGVRRLTLNNSREDPALVRQCLGYLLFERAGVAAPRCSFARVSVNGEDLGVYVNVEPIDNAFVERVFGSRDGNLYEGTLSDFTPDMVLTFDPKNNGEELGRAELAEFSDALSADDSVLLEAIAPFVDVDAFLRFWALETLIQHSDGYNAFRNNFYVYRDPESGVFRFIPWGVDIILDGRGGVQSVYAQSALAYRLYRLPDVRERYFSELDSLLSDVWDERTLDDEITRMASVIEPGLGSRRGSVLEAVDDLRAVVAGRRTAIQNELDVARPTLGGFPSPFMCRE